MNQKSNGAGQPEQKPNNEQQPSTIPSPPAIGNTNVIGGFSEEDLDSCWPYYKSYLIDILNGSYDLNDARNDLSGLIGSEYDKRCKPTNGLNLHERRDLEKLKNHVCRNCGKEFSGWTSDDLPNTYLTCCCPHCNEWNRYSYWP